MAGSDSTSENLRDLVVADGPQAVLDAVDLALTLSVSQVRRQLDEDFLDAHADEATRFFASWLPRLGAFERMEAAEWVGTQYVLSMVHVEHSYGIGARLSLEALTEAARATADSLEGFRAFTEGPDAEVEASVADRMARLAATVRSVHEELAAELRALPTDVPGTTDS